MRLGALAIASSTSGPALRISLSRCCGLNWARKIVLAWVCETAGHVEPGLEDLSHALEGDEGLDHQHHLDGKEEVVLRPRLTERMMS